ncbi:MAG TPA: SAM-dependent chlorinase/fluorinase [Candidatus Limnocylindrales bacterium]|nr:SAM-dependent chlorinase/fluorinase [Candidatus Limnocylindrales bacterium]
MQRPAHPVIGFLTDFGFDGAAATCRGVMLSICPDAQIIDVSHSVPKYRIAAGAFVLRGALPYLPIGVHVAVVDPGVGTDRRPIAIRVRRGDVLVGPDNGLLVPAAGALGGIEQVRELSNRDLWLPVTSSTFHGRDIFAPVAAHLAAGLAPYEAVGPAVPSTGVVRLPEPEACVEGDTLQTEVIYADSFGNLRLAGGRAELDALGWASAGARTRVSVGEAADPLHATVAHSFGAVAPGERLLYVDSSGNLALAENQGDLAARLPATVGDRVRIGPP